VGVVCLLPSATAAAVLDWDVQTWPAGLISETLTNIGNGDIVVTFGGDTAYLDARGGTQSPNLDDYLTGGLSPTELGLYVRTDYPSGALDWVSFTMSFTHTGGVGNVPFTIFDVDQFNLNHIDEIEVTAQTAGGPVNPTSVTTSTCNSFDAVNTVIGTCLADSDSADGSASFAFAQTGITSVTIVYRNLSPSSNPGYQEITLHDVSFSEPAALVKRAFQTDGTPIADGSTLPAGTPFKFVVYVSNPDAAIVDASVRDVLDPVFSYVADSMRFDSSVGSCAAATCTAVEEAAIYAAVNSGTVGTDAPGDDVVSRAGATPEAGDRYVGNAQLDVPAGQVWAWLFTVLAP
jgi:hypothetical protein